MKRIFITFLASMAVVLAGSLSANAADGGASPTPTSTPEASESFSLFESPVIPAVDIQSPANQEAISVTSTSVADSASGLKMLFMPPAGMNIASRETSFGAQTLFEAADATQNVLPIAVTSSSGVTIDLSANNDGSFVITTDGVPAAFLETPWAFDAAGEKVPTSFSWDGSHLLQTLEFTPTTQFPVIADPSLLTVVSCISTLGFATAATIASGGIVSYGDAAAISFCAFQIEADRAAVADKQAHVQSLTREVSATQTEVARLQAANAELMKMLNDPKSTSSQKTYARNQIATNNATIAGDQKLIAADQKSIDALNAEIRDLSYWP
jgi:hypothetical protein